MLKLDDKTIEFLNKIISMKEDFRFILDEICKKLDKGDCDKLRKRFDETFTDFENIKRVYG